jgi:hypothetical protein
MWVQSKYSKDAPVWEVVKIDEAITWRGDSYYPNPATDWCVYGLNADRVKSPMHLLPKSEYIECDPPVVWEVCTREVVDISPDATSLRMKTHMEGKRWRWEGDALVVEQKVE